MKRVPLAWNQSMTVNCLIPLLSCLSWLQMMMPCLAQASGIFILIILQWVCCSSCLVSFLLCHWKQFSEATKKAFISCCSRSTQKYEAVSWQKTNFSVYHILLLLIHITIPWHSEGLEVPSLSLGSPRYLKTKVLSQCRRRLQSESGFETLGTHPMDNDQDFFLNMIWNFLSY